MPLPVSRRVAGRHTRPGETTELNMHITRLSNLIASSGLREFEEFDSPSNPGTAHCSAKVQRRRATRPSTASSARRRTRSNSRTLTHTATLARPSTATSKRSAMRKGRSTPRAYGKTSIRPNTERPTGAFVGSNALDNHAHSPIHYPFLIKKQDATMLTISQAVHAVQSPHNDLTGATADLYKLRQIVETSKRILLDRIDALLYAGGGGSSSSNNQSSSSRSRSSRNDANNQITF